MTNIKTHNVAFAWTGIFAAAIFAAVWIAASSLDTSWEFGKDVLSDLGVSGGTAEAVFNYGSVIAGVFLAIFGIGTTVSSVNNGHVVVGTLLTIAGVLLILVGLVPLESFGSDTHTALGKVFGLVIFAAAAAAAASNWFGGQKIFGGLGLIFVFAAISLYLSYDFAEFESYVAVIGILWVGLEGVALMLRKGNA